MKLILIVGLIAVILISIKKIFFKRKTKYYLHSEKKNGD